MRDSMSAVTPCRGLDDTWKVLKQKSPCNIMHTKISITGLFKKEIFQLEELKRFAMIITG